MEGHFLRCKVGWFGRRRSDWCGQDLKELTAWSLEQGGQSRVSQLWIWTFLGFPKCEAAEGGRVIFSDAKLDGRDGAGQIGGVKTWNELTPWSLEQGGQSRVFQLWIWTFLGFPTCEAAEGGRGIF